MIKYDESKLYSRTMREMKFFIDVSPQWWIKARKNEKFLKNFVIEKFENDYYPRVILSGRKSIDLDKSGTTIKNEILKMIRQGNFNYEFLPEDENQKETYVISNGNIQFKPRRMKTNSRILIRVKI